MGKKKFIEKKKSATFQLFARDSTDPNYNEGPSGDRVYVRVDNNPYPVTGFADEDDPNTTDVMGIEGGGTHFLDYQDSSIFADADEDEDEDEYDDEEEDEGEGGVQRRQVGQVATLGNGRTPLPDDVRREIMELGFPDDGYNYLIHLREIKNAGGGSAYYENSKAKPEILPLDVKAYDASRVRIPEVKVEDTNDNSAYNVASKTVGVRVQRVVDPEVKALLDDSDLSRFGSDVEDLEEDFLVQANLPEEGEDVSENKKLDLVEQPKSRFEEVEDDSTDGDEMGSHQYEVKEKPRVRRLLDEQFDMLTLQEYGSDSDSDYQEPEEEVPLADKVGYVIKDQALKEIQVHAKYKVPADFLKEDDVSKDEVKESAEVIRRCAEYAEKFNDEDQDDAEVVLQEETSDESEMWDCETIVTTYSNLDNHPGKIEVPGYNRKKKLSQTISAIANGGTPMISLRGKEKLPVEFLPHSRKGAAEKVEKVNSEPNVKTNELRRKPHGEESKEEKKERKAAVKAERREARQAKKELKGMYRCETQRAQKVVAFTGPSAIHLM